MCYFLCYFLFFNFIFNFFNQDIRSFVFIEVYFFKKVFKFFKKKKKAITNENLKVYYIYIYVLYYIYSIIF